MTCLRHKTETDSTTLSEEQKQAEKEKQLGNESYKSKKFDTAVQHYTKAHELDPSNVVYLTNRAGNMSD